MPHFTASDGVRLYYEETGSGTPIVFVHEFAGDCRAWEQQMRYFGRGYRCVAFNARGYPPSDVPDDLGMYSQARAVADIVETLDHLGIDKAHCVGLSMGGFAAMHFGLDHADRALSVVIGGVGFGAEPNTADRRVPQGDHPHLGAGGAAENRAHGEPRGTGRLQCRGAGLHRHRRCRPLDAPGQARRGRGDPPRTGEGLTAGVHSTVIVFSAVSGRPAIASAL